MTFYVTLNGHQVEWNKNEVKEKLVRLGKLNGKQAGWIRFDLNVCASNWLTRLVWNFAIKYFNWMRKLIFNVDLEQTRSVLIDLGLQINNNSRLHQLYCRALEKFHTIAPNHVCKALNPNELIIHINEKCIPLDRVGLSPGGIRILLTNHGHLLKFFKLRSHNTITDFDSPEYIVQLLKYCPNIRFLSIQSQIYTDELICEIKKYNELLSLCISSAYANGVTSTDIDKILSSLKNLTHLKIENAQITHIPTALMELKDLSSIKFKKINIKTSVPS
jgi:hypothetical protein